MPKEPIKKFTEGGDVYEIPESKVDAFLKDLPDAKPFDDTKPATPISLDQAVDEDNNAAKEKLAKTATLQYASENPPKEGYKAYQEIINLPEEPRHGVDAALDKAVKAGEYLDNKLVKGATNMLSGAANAVNDMMANAPVPSYQPIGGNGQTVQDIQQQQQEDQAMGQRHAATIQHVRSKVNDFVMSPDHEELEKKVEGMKGIGGTALRTLGGFAEFLPSMAAAPATGGASLFFGGYQDGLDQVAGNDKIDPKLKPLYAMGYGVVNTALMSLPISHALDKVLVDKIASRITIQGLDNAIQATDGKMTGQAFMDAINNAKQDALNKIKIGGIKAAKGFAEGTVFSTGQQAANVGMQHGINSLEGKQVFETPDLKQFIENVGSGALSIGMLNFGMGGFHTRSKDYIKDLVAKAKSPDDLANIHGQVDALAQKGKIAPDHADELHQAINTYATIKKTLPPEMTPEQGAKAFDLITDRNAMKEHSQVLDKQKEMAENGFDVTGNPIDPALKDIAIQNLDKEIMNANTAIEAKNDEIREAATGLTYKYSKKDGAYTKQLGDNQPEEISPELYELKTANKAAQVESQEKVREISPKPAEAPAEKPKAEPVPETKPEPVAKVEPVKPAPEPSPTFSQSEGKRVIIDGEQGTLEKEGQTYVINAGNRVHEIGNIDKLKDTPVSDHGISIEKEDVIPNEDGSFNVRDKVYHNKYSDPLAAINHDEDGNVLSVNLDTPDGGKRTFRGQTAEDIAYHITLKELDKNNKDGEFEKYINEEPAIRNEMEQAEVPEVTEKSANENNAEIPKSQEPVKKEGGNHAVQIEKPNEGVLRDEGVPRKGELPGVGSQNKEPEKTAAASEKKEVTSPSLKIYDHESDNKHAEGKLSKEDNPEQEPTVAGVESTARDAEKAPELEKGIEKTHELQDAALDVKRMPISDIHTNEKKFQGREKLNDKAVKRIAENWSDADQDPIQIWKDPKDGKYYVLSGHHRLAAAKLAGRSDIKVIDRSGDFNEKQARQFATEEANANRTMETPLERARTLRKKRDEGADKKETKAFLEREGKNARFVDNISRLNPEGKAMQMLHAVEDSPDKTTQKEAEKVADWIGEARRSNSAFTDTHENEMFDFLMDKNASKRITTKSDFIHKATAALNRLDPSEPLNLKRFKFKNQGEETYEKERADIVKEISDRQDRINDLNARFTNPERSDYVRTADPEYESMKKIADKKIASLNAEIKGFQKRLQDLMGKKQEYTSGGGQRNLFEEPESEPYVDQNSVIPFAREFVEHDVLPRVGGGVTRLRDITNSIVKFLSPLTHANERGKTAVFKMLGSRELANEKLDGAMHQFERMFDKMTDDVRIDFIDRLKTGEKQRTPELQDIADMLRKLDDDLFRAREDAANLNRSDVSLAWKDNHFRVWWKKIPMSKDEKSGKRGLFRRPLQGTKGSFKHATLPDISTGIELGGEPISTNPIRLFKLSYNDDMKYITAQRMWHEIGNLGLREFVRFGKRPPDGYVKVDDSIARVWFPVKEGMVNAGEWYVDEGVGRMINNYLGKDGLRYTPLGKSLLQLKNVYTAVELGLSGFHAMAESFEASGSQIGLGIRKLVNLGLRGDLKNAKSGIKDILTFLSAPATTAKLGRETIRFTKEKDFKNSELGRSFIKAFPDAEQYIEDFFNAGGLFQQNRDFKTNAFDAIKEAAGKNNYIGATLRLLPTANKMIMQPLFEYYIPALKVGMFMKEFPTRLLEQNGRIEAGKTTRDQIARELVRFIDDRLGETNFDAMFWNRSFKTASQIMFRSITWKVGNLSAFGGAPIEQAMEFVHAAKEHRTPLLEPKMAWLLGLTAMQTVVATAFMKAFTGLWPQNYKDIIAPRISKNDPDERVVLPTYFKDMLHFSHSPSTYISSSLSGMYGKLTDLYHNKDFYGYEIYDPQGDVPEKMKDIVSYSVPLPFSISSYAQMDKEGQPLGKRALGFFGFVKAPSYIVNSPIENEIFDLYHIRMQETRPYKQKAANNLKKAARDLYKSGKVDEAEALLDKAIKDGTLRQTQVKYLMRNIGKTEDASAMCFRELPYSDKEYLYQKMTPEEKAKYDPKGHLAGKTKKSHRIVIHP